jgi:hypothetical protein
MAVPQPAYKPSTAHPSSNIHDIQEDVMSKRMDIDIEE